MSHQSDVHSPHRLGIILVGAGSGERLGAGIPKALVQLSGKTLLERCIETAINAADTGHLVVVAPAAHAAEALQSVEKVTEHSALTWTTSVVDGGAERHISVENGLAVMPEWVEVVLVHDVARPLTPVSIFHAVATAVRERKTGVVPVLPLTDTIKRVDNRGFVLETVNRDELVSAQTPQGFLREDLTAAYEHVAEAMTDDASVAKAAGQAVTTVEGSALAHKITTAADLRLLEWMLDTDPSAGSIHTRSKAAKQ